MALSKEKEQAYIEKVRKDGLHLRRIKKNQTYNICLEAVKENAMAFVFVNDEFKTEELCLIAVKKLGNMIRYIEDPTEEMQLEAIKNNGFVIRSVENPTEEMKLAAIKQNHRVLDYYIEDATEEMILIAIEKDEKKFKMFKKPSEELIKKSIERNGKVLRMIKNQTKELQLMALEQNPNTIQFVQNPTEEMYLKAIRHKVSNAKYCEHLTHRLIHEIVELNGFQYLSNPTEETILEALKTDGTVIDHVKNPTEEMELLASRHYLNALTKNFSTEEIRSIKELSLALENDIDNYRFVRYQLKKEKLFFHENTNDILKTQYILQQLPPHFQ